MPKNNESNDDTNNIGRFLCGEQISGSCVLLKSKINDNYVCSPDNINIDELVDILYSKFILKIFFNGFTGNNKMINKMKSIF